MSYNFINEAASITMSQLCASDTSAGYESDFNENGDVDGWDYYDGIHTYGSWGGFLFGTLYGSYALLGRTSVFAPVSAETHYTLKIIMKINPAERVGSQALPTVGRVMWTTTSNPTWGSDKTLDFTVYGDNLWHAYSLNMSAEQWWQGDIRNLRIYPVYADGRAGDEFFVKSVKITSIDTYRCMNPTCAYYSNYSHPCGGVGTRGYCESSATGADEYTIEEGVNDELIVKINNYGNEIIRLDAIDGGTGVEVSRIIAKSISKVAVGGYAETEVAYTEDGKFKIHSGTYHATSTAEVVYSAAAVTLGFFDSNQVDLSSRAGGSTPVDKFRPDSSFKIKSFQLLSLFDDNGISFEFDPTVYSVEGGRRDWLKSGGGLTNYSAGDQYSDTVGKPIREPNLINNYGKTIIDFNHPFNASGRVKKIYLMCTLDRGWNTGYTNPAEGFQGRLVATGCKVKVYRPTRNGKLTEVTSISIPNRSYSGGKLVSITQESTELDCDIWVNKGDLLGVYNANMYVGKSVSGAETDAQYYQVSGHAQGYFNPGVLEGDGIGGLLIYARSEETQKKLSIDVDFGNRINVEEVNIVGETEGQSLEYNVARCLDVNWNVDMFNETHYTGHVYLVLGEYYNMKLRFLHTNIAYGVNCLSDGIYSPSDGLAADSYSLSPTGLSDSTFFGGGATAGITVTNPRYFFCNGDGEWMGVYQQVSSNTANAWIEDFDEDPIAFTLYFPYGVTKKIYKSVIYFKDRYNFRNFGLSVSYDLNDRSGNADLTNFHRIEEYSAITLDGRRTEKDGPGYEQLELYLFENPCVAKPDVQMTGERTETGGYIGYIDNYTEYLQSVNVDWNTIEHEFGPTECKAFRIYCDYHESTKINEMELYCQVEDVGSSMIGSVDVKHSHYNDIWWPSSLTEDETGSVKAFIGDASRYFNIEIEPITPVRLHNIRFDIKGDDVFVGTKGCEYEILPVHSRLDTTNEGQRFDIKNIYDAGYNLYVGIAEDSNYDEGLVFSSSLESADDINNPAIGPDARYYKPTDYPLLNRTYKNVAINNECYGLRNLIGGKTAYYTYVSEYGWNDFGTLINGDSIDFSNLPSNRISSFSIPVFYRNRYWKFGWMGYNHGTMNVREAKVFYDGDEVECDFYYNRYDANYEPDVPIDFIYGRAYHLNNNSTTGSRYNLRESQYLSFDLGSPGLVDQIVLYHDSFNDYSDYWCGIDLYTLLYVDVKDGNIVDYSYNERNINTVSSGISVGPGRWSRNEAYKPAAVDGLYGADTNPLTGALASEPLYVDGDLYGDGNDASGHALYADYSHGIDFGTPTEINTLHFYGRMHTYSRFENQIITYRVYKSNDNSTWTLVQEFFGLSDPGAKVIHSSMLYLHPHVYSSVSDGDGGYSMAFMLRLSQNHTARYFKLYNDVTPVGYASQTLFIREIEGEVATETLDAKGITFAGHEGSYLSVPGYYLRFPATYGSVYYVDFWVKFDELPANDQDYVVLACNWNTQVPPATSEHNVVKSYSSGKEFILVARNDGGTVTLQLWFQCYYAGAGGGWMYRRNVDMRVLEADEWYYINFWSYMDYDGSNRLYQNMGIYVNGEVAGYLQTKDVYSSSHSGSNQSLVIGKNLNGTISNFRTSNRRRSDFYPRYWHDGERYYNLSVYTSDDNITYGHYCDVDLRYSTPYANYYSSNQYSEEYSTYFAIDLGRRYDLEWIRAYGSTSNRFDLSFYGANSTLIDYSPEDIDDVNQVTWTGRDSYDNTKTIYSAEKTANTSLGGYAQATVTFTAVNCTGLTKANGLFEIQLKVNDTSAIEFSRGSQIELSSSTTNNVNEWYYNMRTNVDAHLRQLTTEYQTFYIPMRLWNTTGGNPNVSSIVRIRWYVYSTADATNLTIYWQGAKAHWPYQDALTVTNDVRWLRFDMPNDGTTRTLRKVGLYPDITTKIGPGGTAYNHEWDSLGKSVTYYGDTANLAAGATVSGSSYFGMQYFEKLTNGVISADTDDNVATLYDVWCSDDDSTPWVNVDLGATYTIYRVKLYHGYDGVDSTYLITGYQIKTSLDAITFTTRLTITGNSSFSRTHDFTAPVNARYVRIAVTSFNNTIIYMRTNNEGGIAPMDGAVMREIEVYEYYDYQSVSTEEYPLMCINLNDQFFLNIYPYGVVGFDAEDSTEDWVVNYWAMWYSDNVLTEPKKIDFRFQVTPGYEQWVAFRYDTAENYRAGPHYLKNFRVEADYAHNACEYPWWWASNLSTLSRDYDYGTENSVSAVRIDYPASSSSDTVRLIEGDDFGVDELASWRDGLNFRFRIDDIDNLDLSYGYFYFGGYDSTDGYNPIIYKWNISTISGTLSTGWTNLFLRFKEADSVSYTPAADLEIPDVRLPNTITFGTIGMVFKGVGNPLTMHLDGFYIRRNHFNDYVAYGRGLYLTQEDYLICPLGEFDMSRGSIEFWMRPDFDYDNYDNFDRLINRAIFQLNNNANDVLGLMVTHHGFEVYSGNINEGLSSFALTGLDQSILDTTFHLGIVFSNDGTQIDSDSSTVRVYLNNYLIAKSTTTWNVYDNKHFKFMMGGKGPLTLKMAGDSATSSVDAVLRNLKIYNYCKKDFESSIFNREDPSDDLVKPSNLIEISKDNLTYYKVGDAELPLMWHEVPAGDVTPVYVRTNVSKTLTGEENRTAGLLVYWDMAI